MSASPSDDERALDEQQALVESSLPLLFDTWDDANAHRVKDPVILLVDCEDDIGGEIARAWLGDDAVAAAITDTHAEDQAAATTVFARFVPWLECCSEIPRYFPYLEPALSAKPPKDAFLTISITSGGASALTVPLTARTSFNS